MTLVRIRHVTMSFMSAFNITSTSHQARDGIRLAIDIYRPADSSGEPLPGPFPTVLIRTPYDRKGTRYRRDGEFWARNGYVLAVEDCRGRFDSEGNFVLLANEGPDGFDTIEWLAQQSFSNGRIGTYGTSYSGWVQNAAAIERPPSLSAMWVTQSASNGATSSLRHNGTMELRWLTWAVTHGAVSPEALSDPAIQTALSNNGIDMYSWLRKLPWGEGPENTPLHMLPDYDKWAKDLYLHSDLDESEGAFWAQSGLNFEPYYNISANVPTVYCGGWYDSYTRATVENFQALGEMKDHQYLLMGPWIHGGMDSQISGSVDLGDDANPAVGLGASYINLVKSWFDHWLPEEAYRSTEDIARVRTFVMGGGSGNKTAAGKLLHGGSWREDSNWPPQSIVVQPYYLHEDGLLDPHPAPELKSSTSFIFNPEQPLPTISANTSSLNEIVSTPDRIRVPTPITLMRVQVIQGGADQVTDATVLGAEPPFGPLEDRGDVIIFETMPLEVPREVTGPLEVELFLESDAPDTDLFVMLQDEYPPSADWSNGYKLNIADGIFRVRYRESMSEPKLMAPGVPVKVRFDLYPTSNIFGTGHRIRLMISSSSFPRFDVNPNTGEPVGRHTSLRKATNTIHHSQEFPSRILLPIKDS